MTLHGTVGRRTKTATLAEELDLAMTAAALRDLKVVWN
jgi:hypothetical protein